jgi:hypothetical protein
MNIFFRYKSDGTRALSYVSYLGLVIGSLALIYFLHSKPSITLSLSNKMRGARVAPITQKAALAEPIKNEKLKPARKQDSFRLPADKDINVNDAKITRNVEDSPLAYALHNVDNTNQDYIDTRYPQLLPALAPEKPKSFTNVLNKEVNDSELKWLYYDSEFVTKSDEVKIDQSHEVKPKLKKSIPRGSLLDVCLLSTVDTSNPNALVECALVRDFIFNHIKMVNFGVRFLGKLSGAPIRGRINLLFDTIVTPTGRQISFNASAVQKVDIGFDYRPGLAAKLISPPVWVEASPYVGQVVTGFLNYFKSQVNNPVVVSSAGLSFQQSASAELKSAGALSSASAVEDLSISKQKQWNEMYGAYYLVPGGTYCSLQLQSELDVTQLESL